MITPLATAALLSLVIWLVLLLFRGGFWRAGQGLPAVAAAPSQWPTVVAVVPARDEAAVIERSLGSLLAQDYLGKLSIVLVDDASTDGTGALAEALARTREDRLTVMAGAELAAGWTGKLWALAQGVARATADHPEAHYLLLTDADIAHDPGVVRRLVAQAEATGCDLVSVMARLDSTGFWARLLIPAFVFFFQKLYPFPWVNDPRKATAAAAGGCVLVRWAALAEAGGIAAIRGALIDDCTLAQVIKHRPGGPHPIWLGFDDGVASLRPYRDLGEIWHMVARTAYTQLAYSPLALAGTVLGMVLVYLVPPAAALAWPWHGDALAGCAGLAGWLIMAAIFLPALRRYGEPAALAVLLPLAGLLYTLMTLDSARRHWFGRGGAWKGRTHGALAKPPADP